MVLFGVSTVAGAITATLLSDLYLPNEQIAAAAIAFSAGIFIYVAVADLLPPVNSADNRLTSSFFFIGVILYFLLNWGTNLLVPSLH